MFAIAREIVRHKVGVVAVASFAVFVFAGPKNQDEAASSPWAKQAPSSSQAPANQAMAGKDDTFTAKLGNIAEKAGDYAAEKVLGDKELNPVKMAGESTERFEQSADAMSQANGN